MSEIIAVLIPCFNEDATIAKVVTDFKRELPEATIYVYDNNSSDETAELALKAGAIVRTEKLQGKGNVVRSMLRDIDADIYVTADGDDTYPAEQIHDLLQAIRSGADMAVGDRLSSGAYAAENKRLFHRSGNNAVLLLINRLFGSDLCDIMSGYRVFSKRFAQTYPALCEGFQLETDMTIFALSRKLSVTEIPVEYRDRPKGSVSKLDTFSDGAKVIGAIFNLYRFFHPLRYFGTASIMFAAIGLIVGVPVVAEFVQTSYITKVPSAILASGCMILSIIAFSNGLILDALSRSEREHFERELKRNRS